MKPILLMALTAFSLFAADATGTWTGTFTPDGQDPGPAYIVLKQDGVKLTGTGGPSPEESHEIVNGKAEDGTITFDVVDGDVTMKFVLKQEGDQMKGEASRLQNGETLKAKLVVTRSK